MNWGVNKKNRIYFDTRILGAFITFKVLFWNKFSYLDSFRSAVGITNKSIWNKKYWNNHLKKIIIPGILNLGYANSSQGVRPIFNIIKSTQKLIWQRDAQVGFNYNLWVRKGEGVEFWFGVTPAPKGWVPL
jgi:hypothetical protein